MGSQLARESRVLIIGTGPAGAFLAQILRGKGIAFEIFERETDLHERKGGGFALDSALPTMTELLPSELNNWWTTSVNYPNYDNTLQIDANTMEVSGYQLGQKPGSRFSERPRSMIVCRSNFRSWMVQNLHVQTVKQLSHYEEGSSGVTIYFKDGSQRVCISSLRRRWFRQRQLHKFVPICASFNIKGEPLRRLRALATSGVVTANENSQIMVSPLELTEGADEARYWWVVAIRSQNPEADTNWVHSASQDDLFAKVMEIAASMPDFTHDTLKIAGPSSVWNPQIRFSEYVTPTTLPTGRVTLMGDAAHNTTPYAGRGANTGLQDAGDLGKLLFS